MVNPGEIEAIVYVGHVLTMDDQHPTAAAVATQGDEIIFVGDRDAALEAAGRTATVVELEPGQVLLPGFIDGHGHIALVTLFNSLIDLTPKPTGRVGGIVDLVATLKASIADGPPPTGWVSGCNYDDALMREHRHPTRDDLDEVSTQYPVLAIHASGHLAAVNSKALELCGVGPDTPDPVGGSIRRREGSREPNGVLEEHAWMDLVAPHLPRPGPEQAVRDLVAAQLKYASQGFTTVQDGATDPAMLALLRGADQAGAVVLDLVAYPTWMVADQVFPGTSPDDGYQGRVRIGGLKLVLDGSPQGKTAWLSEPYLIPPPGQGPDYRGYPALDDETVNAFVRRFHDAGWQVLAHCNGDEAAAQFIRAATAARGAGQSGEPRDFVMIHAQTVREDQLDEMVRIGIVPSFFITHVYYWGDWHRDSVLGLPRAARISPLESARGRGIRFSLHNDSPVAPIRSMLLISTAVNRLTLTGQVLGAEQRIPVESALRAMTIDAAIQYGEEDTKGSIVAGKQADLVMLSDNPLTIDPAGLADIQIVRTVSRGRTVFGG